MTKAGTKEVRSYDLSCGHTVLFGSPPRKGEYVWCFRCEKYIVYIGKSRRKDG